MQSLVMCLQGKLGLEKIEELIHVYKETSEDDVGLFHTVYAETNSLHDGFGIEDKWSQSC